MSDMLVWIPGEPKAQPRPKGVLRGGFVHFYTPPVADKWKGLIKEAIKASLTKFNPLAPFRVTMVFFFKRPSTHYGSKNKVPYLRTGAPISHTTKPDLDNLAKAVMDALSDVKLWNDDRQVIELEVSKRYGEGWTEGLQLSITELP